MDGRQRKKALRSMVKACLTGAVAALLVPAAAQAGMESTVSDGKKKKSVKTPQAYCESIDNACEVLGVKDIGLLEYCKNGEYNLSPFTIRDGIISLYAESKTTTKRYYYHCGYVGLGSSKLDEPMHGGYLTGYYSSTRAIKIGSHSNPSFNELSKEDRDGCASAFKKGEGSLSNVFTHGKKKRGNQEKIRYYNHNDHAGYFDVIDEYIITYPPGTLLPTEFGVTVEDDPLAPGNDIFVPPAAGLARNKDLCDRLP